MRKDIKKASRQTTSNQDDQPDENSHQQQGQHEKKTHEDKRDMMLSRKDARGGSPSDVSVGGEEDAGVGLEFLVNKKEG